MGTTAALGWPLVLMGWALASLLVARLVLGRWPHMYGGDDPKDIPVVSVMHTMLFLGFAATVPTVIAGLVAVGWIARRRWRLALIVLGVGAGCWALALGIVRLTEVTIWIMD